MRQGSLPHLRGFTPAKAAPAARIAAMVFGAMLLSAVPAARPAEPLGSGPPALAIRDLTWLEVRAALQAGYKTVLVPTGGIEQNGAHMILGKHDYIVGWAAHRVALGAGKTLVAPVISYVPEGSFEPPTGHMRFPGTLGVSGEAFAGVLDGIARSLKTHGFTLICFMGDHGASQPVQSEVAGKLSKEWAKEGVRVINLDAYYNDSEQVKRLQREGETPETIGQHATIIDTSELLAIHPAGIYLERVPQPGSAAEMGSSGDPSRASAERGRDLITMRVEAAIAQLRAVRMAN